MLRDVLVPTCFVDGRDGRSQFSRSGLNLREGLKCWDRDVPTLLALRMATLARIVGM